MVRIKRLHSFVLKTFFPLLFATFSVCLFILLMQFLWQYVSDMVGKGVGVGILAELFFYAGLTFTPMALPLSILLASLMTFGNLGEHLELLAMKASGISLIRIMKPIIITIVFLMLVSLYFQNNILPPAQTKMYTILFSLRQKSPELDIPEGTFYKEITGYNVYVRQKDKKNGFLYDMMVYDYSKGFENAVVIVADTGKLDMSDDKMNLILSLYSGEWFENFGPKRSSSIAESVPYRRETFSVKKILIPFDTNFNRADESIMGNRDIGKDIGELTLFVDSIKHQIDSVSVQTAPSFKKRVYTNSFKQPRAVERRTVASQSDSLFDNGFQAFYDSLNIYKQLEYANKAKNKVQNINNEYSINSMQQREDTKALRNHQVQLHKRFTLSVACLLFFFIGAPLGAIIRKGGLGMPAVISVFLFLAYYTVDTFGVKMTKQGVWTIVEGVWLSSAVLLLLGVFFTYKAVNDSVMMNPDAWKIAFQRLIGKREVRNYSRKEVVITPSDYPEDIKKMNEWNLLAQNYLGKHKKIPFYTTFWKRGFYDKELDALVSLMDSYIEDLKNSEENLIVGKLMDYPVVRPVHLSFLNKTAVRWTCAILLPVGLSLYFIGVLKQKQVNKDLKTIYKVNEDLKKELNPNNDE